MGTDKSEPEAEVYGPDDQAPVNRRAPATLPHPEALLPADFPVTGLMQLLRLARATRLSKRYAAALDAMVSVSLAAAGVEDAKLELHRAIRRLEDKDNVLRADQAQRDTQRLRAEAEREEARAALEGARVRAEGALAEARILAEARKLQAEIEVYRAKRTIAMYKNDTAAGGSIADQISAAIDRLVTEMSG